MQPPVFVFDAYGTLFDVHAAIARHREAVGADADYLSEMWRTKQLEYTWTLTLAGRYLDFWTLTEQALDYALARTPSVDRSVRSKLLDSYIRLDAFPDARTCLHELKRRGLRTAILSNGSPRMLDAAVEAAQLRDAFDATLSVDAIRLYKPRPEVYRLAADAFAVDPGEIVFASSNRWDAMGAATFGFRAAWINRAGVPDEYAHAPVSLIVPDLLSLPAIAD